MPNRSRCVIALLCLSACAAAQGWIYAAGGTYDEQSPNDPCYGSTSPFPTCYSSGYASFPLKLGIPRDSSGAAITGRTLDANCYRPSGAFPAWSRIERYPQQRVDVPVSTMKGVQFVVQFNSGPLTGSGDIIEALYFHESVCFYGGREYGFYSHAGSDYVYAYWAVNANCPAPGDVYRCLAFTDTNCDITCSNLPGPPNGVIPLGPFAGAPYAFQMIPTPLGPKSCYFQISVWDASGRLVYDAPAMVDDWTLSADPFFCDASLGILNESGYLTMGTVFNFPTYSSVGAENYLYLSQAAWLPNVHLDLNPLDQ